MERTEGLDLLFPKDVKVEDLDGNRCRLTVAPLENGFGVTVGNALRRVLLGYIPGYAINTISIKGVDHEFTRIEGVRQMVLYIVLNLKTIVLRKKDENNPVDEETICVKKRNGVFVGADITNASKFFEVVNGDVEICDFAKDVDFEIILKVNKGVGFKIAQQFDNAVDKIGTIHIDSNYAPIINVSYFVNEKFHLDEENRYYDSLSMEVTTNGSILAKDAVNIAAKILVKHFKLFINDSNYVDDREDDFINKARLEDEKRQELFSKSLVDVKLSVRACNCLRKVGVLTVRQLVDYLKDKGNDVISIKSLGGKTKDEIYEFLKVSGCYESIFKKNKD